MSTPAGIVLYRFGLCLGTVPWNTTSPDTTGTAHLADFLKFCSRTKESHFVRDTQQFLPNVYMGITSIESTIDKTRHALTTNPWKQ